MNDYRPLIFRNPRLIPAMLFSAGLGVAGYYGMAWHQMPTLSDAEIEQSTELNLALDLAQMSADQRPQGQALEALKLRVRAEVESDVGRDRQTLQERFAAGLVAMVFGLGQLVFVFLNERARKTR
jgi:hypothetical protein